MGCPPRIPANATILAKIQLLTFHEESAAEAILADGRNEDRPKRSLDDVIQAASAERDAGNLLFKEKDFGAAQKRYIHICYSFVHSRINYLALTGHGYEPSQRHFRLRYLKCCGKYRKMWDRRHRNCIWLEK